MDPQDQAALLRKLAQPTRLKLAMTETRKGVKSDTAKASPLVNQTRSGARPTSTPLEVAPDSSVDQIDIPHVHRHEGTTENVRAYFHAHPHSHAIAHDPDDPSDVVDHDRRDHLGDPRHVAALRGFGGWESKSAGTSPSDAIKAIQADSEKVQGEITNRNIPLNLINERLADNASAIRQLSTSAELADLRKGASPTRTKRAPARTIPFVAKRVSPDLAKKVRSLDPLLDLVKKREALRPLLDHSDFNVRSGAQELMAQKLAEIEKFGRVDITKTRTSASLPDSVKAAIHTAIQRGVGDLVDRINTLDKRL